MEANTKQSKAKMIYLMPKFACSFRSVPIQVQKRVRFLIEFMLNFGSILGAQNQHKST